MKVILKTIDLKEIQENTFDISGLDVDAMPELLDISNQNYEKFKIVLNKHNKYYIYVKGQNKWSDLVACGTYENIIVENEDNLNECKVTESLFICGVEKLVDDRKDNEPQEYDTVIIGDQCWMAEDLKWKCDNYWEEEGKISENWSINNQTNCAPSGSDGNTDYSDTILYQWGVLTNSEGVSICPPDWHVPNDTEWKQLEMYLGMTQVVADNTGWRGIDEGDQLKDCNVGSWCKSPSVNDSGFNALPAGYRNSSTGALYYVGSGGSWWSSTEDGSSAWRRYLNVSSSGVYRYSNSKAYGFALRCVAGL